MSCRASAGYYLIDAGEGVFASVSLFENAKEAHESTRTAARWVREHELESALPNTPKITAGPVIAHQSPAVAAVANGVPALCLKRPDGDHESETRFERCSQGGSTWIYSRSMTA